MKISAREIRDSRGKPTVEATVEFDGLSASASVPSGKSTGKHEAVELRDSDGDGVQTAITNIEGLINDVLRDAPLDPMRCDALLEELDGTAGFSRLGANAVLPVSIALRRVAAQKAGLPLWQYIEQESGFERKYPSLFMNVINGGAHANFRLPIQEHIIVTHGDPHASYKTAVEIFDSVGRELQKRMGEVDLGDEGGFAVELGSELTAFEILKEAIGKHDARIAIDAAASSFYVDGAYRFGSELLSGDQLLERYVAFASTFNMFSIEDPFEESDDAHFQALVLALGKTARVVGDDYLVTNAQRVTYAAALKSANAMIVKPNQAGSLRKVYEAVRAAKNAGWYTIASHRSGETEDDFLADLAVGIGADALKAGAPTQKERRAKYERLLTIEQEMA